MGLIMYELRRISFTPRVQYATPASFCIPVIGSRDRLGTIIVNGFKRIRYHLMKAIRPETKVRTSALRNLERCPCCELSPQPVCVPYAFGSGYFLAKFTFLTDCMFRRRDQGSNGDVTVRV